MKVRELIDLLSQQDSERDVALHIHNLEKDDHETFDVTDVGTDGAESNGPVFLTAKTPKQ